MNYEEITKFVLGIDPAVNKDKSHIIVSLKTMIKDEIQEIAKINTRLKFYEDRVSGNLVKLSNLGITMNVKAKEDKLEQLPEGRKESAKGEGVLPTAGIPGRNSKV